MIQPFSQIYFFKYICVTQIVSLLKNFGSIIRFGIACGFQMIRQFKNK